MYHSVTFDGKNSWDDWHLIPTSRPVIDQPKLQENYLEIPGVGGTIDISELLSNHPIYSDREGAIEFAVLHDYWRSWEETRTEIANHLAGRVIDVILEDDPSYFYHGRCELERYSSEKDYSRVEIRYHFEPFKRLIDLPENQIEIRVANLRAINIQGSVSYDSPTFIVSEAGDSGLYVGDKDEWIHLPNGKTTDDRIKLGPGSNPLVFRGNGVVTIDYRRGLL